MTTLDEYIEQQLAAPEFAQAWEDSEDESDTASASGRNGCKERDRF